MFRQGDVLLLSVEQLPGDAEQLTSSDRIILAYGEVTGHAHAVAAGCASLFVDRAERYLKVGCAGAELVHEEHATISLPEGVYRVILQREYVPDGSRLVLD